MKIVFIDYPDGDGGEFLSQVISMHPNFYRESCAVSSEQTSRFDLGGTIYNFLNSARYHNHSNWTDIAELRMLEFKEKIETLPAEKICVPYHAYTHQEYKLLKKIWPDCTVVGIWPKLESSWKLLNFEILRKVYLIKYSLNDIKHVFHFNKKIQLDLKNFIGLDVLLLKNNLDITNFNRKATIERIMQRSLINPGTCDFLVSWENFFINIDTILTEYQKLCNFLQIEPQHDILQSVIERNKKNLTQLMNFDLEESCKKFNIL